MVRVSPRQIRSQSASDTLTGVFPYATRVIIITTYWIASHTAGPGDRLQEALGGMSERSGGRLKRIIAVTLGLIGVGAIVGGITSMVALTLVSLAGGARTLHDLTFGLGFAGAFGAAIGAVLAPVEAWILLRRVPLWRAIAETAVGTVLGALAFTLVLPGPIIGAVVGFTLAAIRLRIATRGGRSLKSRSVDALPP